MLRRRLLTAAIVTAVLPVATLGITSCDSDSNKPATVEPDEVYVAVIRWELAREGDATVSSVQSPVQSSQPEADLPIVYVAAADGSEISAKVQAKVAAATVDDAIVRFADSPDDVVDPNDQAKPVIDDGVLLSVQRIEDDPSQRRTTDVVVYRSTEDQQTWSLTIDAAGDGATITSSTLQPT